MPKENVYPPDHERVKDQQQCSRISQNFRATKSFLVRKRPRETFHSHQKDGTAIGSPGSAASIKRVPLKDISVNSPSLLSINRLELINAKCSGGPWESAVQRDGECLSNSFITPVKPVEVSTSNESVSIPFLLDDDFDESFLQEIDAICEKSAAKAEREAQSRIFHEKSGYNYNRSSSESVTTNAHTSMADSLDHGDYMRAGVDMQEIDAMWEKSAAEAEREAHSMIFHEESRHSDNCGSSESVTTNEHKSMADSSDHGDYMRAGADTQEIDAIWEKSAAKAEREAQRRIFHEESQYNRRSLGSVATSEHASMEDSLDHGDYMSAGVDMQEIDAICEKSAAKSEREAQSSIFNEENQLNDNRGSSESITTSKHTSRADSLDHDDYRKAGVYMQELDAICEKSATKAKREAQSRIFHEETRLYDNRSSSETVTTNEHTNMADSLHPGDYMKAGVDEKDTSQTVQNEGMPAEYTKYLQSLNDRQREAACSDISIPLLIAAGPGSGKTSTMVGRILYMLNEGLSSSNILAMTFTTAAASEMRDRIGAVAGKATAKELTISTFHSFSLQLCRAHAEKLGRTLEFLIYGHGQQRRAIIEAVRLLENSKSRQNPDANKLCQDSNGLSCPQYLKDKSRKWQKFVTQAKASGKTPADCIKMGDEIGAAILGNYNDILRSCNALDYHDLISCSVKLLTDFPEVLKECQELWKAIIIDEFQDTSAMQYSLLQTLASHKCITVVGDDDQSIFSFNGADISGFDSFRKDFANHKEVRLTRNYRSTRCIVEAASSLIQHNTKRCQLKNALTENSYGSKITIKECHNEDAQCAFVVDKILEMASDGSASKGSWGNIAVLYRRQVSGKVFQKVFRERRIPFNIHGVAFYRKKVVRAIIGMLKTTLPGSDDGPYRQAFKALLPFEKEEKKRVISHIEKISTVRNCSFLSAARDIFSAKISGTFKRSQLTQGRKVLSTLEMISKLAWREQSISAVITSVANMLPQKYLLEQRAVVDSDGGKLLNEDNDLRSVLQYLLDDVSDFLSTRYTSIMEELKEDGNRDGCLNLLTAFIDYISERETENFRTRKHDNQNSVTLTTIHQAKGLEWDTVFIIKANETEIPLLHECQDASNEKGTSVEEERRLLYVAMTRGREKLFILHVTVDSDWKLLQPSRFLKEIPRHLLEIQVEIGVKNQQKKHEILPQEAAQPSIDMPTEGQPSKLELVSTDSFNVQCKGAPEELTDPVHGYEGNTFLKRFEVDNRSVVSHLFHQWAKRKAFQEPKRLLDKVRFVIDERLRVKTNKYKDVLRTLRSCLSSEEAFHYAEYVLRWEQVPADKRAHLMREKQEHFQKLRLEKSMGSSAPTPKQIAFLQGLGCTVAPTSRLHASRLIEQYRAL